MSDIEIYADYLADLQALYQELEGEAIDDVQARSKEEACD
jgi:hypothetical protein